MAPRQGACPGATPGSRTSLRSSSYDVAGQSSLFKLRSPNRSPHAERQLAQPSLQNSVCSGQHRGGLPFSRGRGRQVMHLPCKQVDAGALPADSTISLCGENEIQASFISSASVGATPTPATILGLESEQSAGFKRRMSSIGLAKEDFPRIGIQAMDGGPIKFQGSDPAAGL